LCSCADYFVTGDNQGGLGIWKLVSGAELTEADPVSVGAVLQGFVTVGQLGGAGRKESIRTLQFLPSGEHLIVGTNERLLLILVPAAANFMKYRGEMRAGIFKSVCNICRPPVDAAGTTSLNGIAAIEETEAAAEEDAAPAVTRLTPLAGLVIKSKSPSGRKVFINVTHHHSLPPCFSLAQCPPYVPPPHIIWDNHAAVSDGAAEAEASITVSNDSGESSMYSPGFPPASGSGSLPASPSQSHSPSPLSSVLALLGQVQMEEGAVLQRPFIAVSEESESEDSSGVTSAVFTVVVSMLLYSKLDSNAIREVILQFVNAFMDSSH
jgi:hypothetical protein